MVEADAVMDVGKTLQDARIIKNLSLDTAAQETNIRRSYLDAIEQNDFASLHGDVFVKGVIRTYGNYLGLDGAQLVEEYKSAYGGAGQARNNNTIRESRHVKVRPTFKSNRDIGSGNGDTHRGMFIFVGILAIVLAAAGGIYFYLHHTGQEINTLLPFRFENGTVAKEQKTNSVLNEKKYSESEKNSSVPQKPIKVSGVKAVETKVKETQSDEKKAEQPAQVLAAKDAPPKTRETNLKITSTGKCWLRVTDQQGTVLFQGNLLKGQSKTFTSNSNIIMRIGNLKVLQIEHNGKALPFESANEAVTRVYTPKEA